MALSVAPVNNPTLTGLGSAPKQTITKVGVATPGTNGFASLNGPALHVAGPVPGAPAADPNAALIQSLINQANAANQKVYAPALNTGAIYSQANATANANVNPYYTKLLNDFVGQQATAKQQQQQQTDFNIKNLQDQLAQTLQANTVTGTRTTEDTANSEAQAAQVADNRQVDQGTQFNTDRNALAVKEAGAGLTGSGLAAGAQATAQQAHDTTETRQAQTDQAAKDATELAKARTFEDLATSNTNATSSEGKGETQANFDLNKFITGQASDLQNEQQTLESQRQSALANERQNQTKILVSNFINSIANPAQRQAAYSAYGSLL